MIIALGLVSENERNQILSFCESIGEQMTSRLKSEEHATSAVVITACAAIAFYNYLLVNSQEDFFSFKAGDVTVKQNYEARVENATKFKNECLVSAAPYLTDISFVFEAVEV